MVKTNNKFSTMNKHFFVSMLLGIMLLSMLTSIQSVFAQKMTLTVNKNLYYEDINFELAGEGEVTINWGDGKKYNDVLGPNSISYEHSYSPHKVPWIITITGENIRYFVCRENNLTSLDVSKNIELEYLNCNDNKLISLDVSKNIKLKELVCSANKLTSLDVSKNIKLKELYCVTNQLTSLNVSKNIELEAFYCDDNKIKSLDVSKNIKLEKMGCNDNELKSLDVSKNIELEYLSCGHNKLTYLVLNALFESLHDNDVKDEKIVWIGGNSGYFNCDKSIAEKKGWKVRD